MKALRIIFAVIASIALLALAFFSVLSFEIFPEDSSLIIYNCILAALLTLIGVIGMWKSFKTGKNFWYFSVIGIVPVILILTMQL